MVRRSFAVSVAEAVAVIKFDPEKVRALPLAASDSIASHSGILGKDKPLF